MECFFSFFHNPAWSRVLPVGILGKAHAKSGIIAGVTFLLRSILLADCFAMEL